MKITHKQAVLAAALIGVLTSAHAQTPDSVQTRIGTLSFERGYPTPETTQSPEPREQRNSLRPEVAVRDAPGRGGG